MESLLAGLSQHGYSILFTAVLLEALGVPVPAALALLVAGAACARGAMLPWLTLLYSLSGMLIGDIILFLMGRYTGWWFLGILCRVSLNPESCIFRSAEAFHKRGRVLLLFAKFLPGINSMAPPLAGSMNMRFAQFLGLDSAGALLYIGGYMAIGFLFSDALGAIASAYHIFGRLMSWIVVTALIAYLVFRAWLAFKSRRLLAVPAVSPAEAAKELAEGATIYDVRSHGYYDRSATRVKGSQRLDPNAISRWQDALPHEKLIFLYCT